MSALRKGLPGRGVLGRGGPSGRTPWAVWAVALAVLALALGMAQAWSNIERMDLAYELGSQQAMLTEKQTLADKLEVERDSLLSSHRLRAKAEGMGLEQAGTGRLRVMEPASAASGATGGGQGS